MGPSISINGRAGDDVGTGLTVACAVHCVALPIVLALLPAAVALSIPGIHLLRSPAVETALVAASVVTGLTVLGHARLVRHRSARPLTLFLAGCTLLLLGRFLGEEQPVGRLVPVAAATFLVSAHRRNRRCCLHAALHGPSARDVCSADPAATRLH